MVFVLAALALLADAVAQSPPVPEQKAKAAFLYNFAKLVQWPAGTFSNRTAPIVIGVLGRDPVVTELEATVADKAIGRRPVRAVRFARIEDVRECHVLFISDLDSARLAEALKLLKGRPILTVSDTPEFARRGGMIGLLRLGDRIRFEVNTASAQEAKLVLSSKLLQFAHRIHPPPP